MRFAWLTNDIFFKLFSLGASILLFVFVNTQTDQPVELDFPVEYRTDPELVIINEPPKKVEVTLLGPWANLRALVWTQDRQPLIVDLRGRSAGEWPERLDPYGVHPPTGMSVASIVPGAVHVVLDRRIEKMLTVEPVLQGPPPFGYEIGEVRVEPSRVRVAGPKTLLQGVGRVETRSLDVTAKDADFQASAPLVPPAKLVELLEQSSVSVSVAIREELTERHFKDLAVKVQGADAARVSPSKVSFTVKGPRRAVEGLDADALEVIVEAPADSQKPERALKAVEIRGLPERVAVLGETPRVDVQAKRKK